MQKSVSHTSTQPTAQDTLKLPVHKIRGGSFVSSYDLYNSLKPTKTYNKWMDGWAKLRARYWHLYGEFFEKFNEYDCFIPFELALGLCDKSKSKSVSLITEYLKQKMSEEIASESDCNYRLPIAHSLTTDPNEVADYLFQSARKREMIISEIAVATKKAEELKAELIMLNDELESHDMHFLEQMGQKTNSFLKRTGYEG